MHFQTVFKWLLRKNNFWDNSPSPAQEARLMTPGVSYGWGFSHLCRKKGQAVRGWVARYRIKEREFPARLCQSEVPVGRVFWPVGKTHGKPQFQNTDVCQPLLDFHLVPRSFPKVEKAGLWSASVNYVASPVSNSVGCSSCLNIMLRFLRPPPWPKRKGYHYWIAMSALE